MDVADVVVGQRYAWMPPGEQAPTVVTVSNVDTGRHGIAAPYVKVTEDSTGREFDVLGADFAAAATAAPPWDCEAHDAAATGIGAWCFFSGELHQRICDNAWECAGRMIVERQRAYRRMNELAAAGNPAGQFLEQEFTHPEQILGGRAPIEDQQSWPAHLRDNALSEKCGSCGRQTWNTQEFGRQCGMSQPDGGRCTGRFSPEGDDHE